MLKADNSGNNIASFTQSGRSTGVWVIAETNNLPTKFVHMVGTDDQGRYLIPDLPKANYTVWVRGYGLADSPKSKSAIGKMLNFTAVTAPNARAAAAYYPAGHWLSLLKVPDKSEFPGTGPTGNGISPNVNSQAEWLRVIRSGGCPACHHLVITQWDWADAKSYLHDVVSTDRRIPTINAKGLLYGALELSADYLPVLDPIRHTASRVQLTVRDTTTQPATGRVTGAPSPYWGEVVLWTSRNNVHNPMFDEKGRVWIASTVRPADNPAFCKVMHFQLRPNPLAH